MKILLVIFFITGLGCRSNKNSSSVCSGVTPGFSDSILNIPDSISTVNLLKKITPNSRVYGKIFSKNNAPVSFNSILFINMKQKDTLWTSSNNEGEFVVDLHGEYYLYYKSLYGYIADTIFIYDTKSKYNLFLNLNDEKQLGTYILKKKYKLVE